MAVKKSKHDNLGFLGVKFQERLVQTFIEDKDFFCSLVNILDQNMFTDAFLRTIVGLMKDYYSEYETTPTYETLGFMISGRIDDDISRESHLAKLDEISKGSMDGVGVIKDQSEKFFKQQNIVKAIKQAETIVKSGDFNRYYEIEDLFRKALDDNTNQENYEQVFDHIEETLSEDYREVIPTGFNALDSMLEGGLGKTELGVIIAPSGVGKSSATTGFAAFAATYKCEKNFNKGFKVLHYFFEDQVKTIRRKYFAYCTQVEAKDLHKPEYRTNIINYVRNTEGDIQRMIQDNIRFQRLSSNEITASEIKTRIKRQIARGFKPDLVIIDYFECLKLENAETRNDEEFSRQGRTMRKLESIANELNIALWVPIQGNRGSMDKETVGMADGGGSIMKVQVGHVVMSFARTLEMQQNDLMTIQLLKFRGGAAAGVLENIVFNNGTCRFSQQKNGGYGTPYINQMSADEEQQKRIAQVQEILKNPSTTDNVD